MIGEHLAAHVVTQVEDRSVETYPRQTKGHNPSIRGVVDLEQMGYRVDPTTGKLVKGLPLMF